MTSTLRNTVILATIGVSLAACGSSDPKSAAKATPTQAITAAAASGPLQSTGDFSYRAPKGWQMGTPPTALIVSVAGDPADKDGFTDNVNVVKIDPSPARNFEELEKGTVAELKKIKATQIKLRPRIKVDGDLAAHVTGKQNQNGGQFLTDQFTMIHGKVNYAITFSFSTDVPIADQESISQSVIATWHWKD